MRDVVSNPLLSTAEAAAMLGVKPQTLRKWRWAGGGPAYVRQGVGLRARAAYFLADLEAWAKARRFENTTCETAALAATGGR